MNKQAIFHYNDSSYCFPIDETHLKLRLRTAKNDEDIEWIECFWNLSFKFWKEQIKTPMTLRHQDDLFDYYECVLESEDPRFCYAFCIHLKDGSHYFYTEEGLTRDYNFFESNISALKMAYMNKLDIHKRNKEFEGRICYQIFPERFNLADKNIDKSYVTEPWDTWELKGKQLENGFHNVFIGGDLEGIIQKLDYLKKLNVGVIYMTPICKSPSNHKYDVEDYFMIDPMFGDDKKLKELVTKAHEKDIKIVLDLVFNHSSKTNPMFEDVILNGKDSKYYDFYSIKGEKPDPNIRNYETFAEVSRMPKLNTNNYKVQDYLISVAKYFLKKFKIDGYRLDVANEVSHSFWQRFKNELRRINPDLLIIGECWNNSYKYLDSGEFDGVMNYQFLNATKDFYICHTINAEQYKNRLESLLMRYDDNTNINMFNLIDSHDTPRFYEFVKPNEDLYMLAVLTLISHIGIPMVYYGDEISMEGSFDPYNRRGMQWQKENFNTKYFKLFNSICHLRDLDTFKYGEMDLDNEFDFFVIRRFDKEHSYKIIINNSNENKEYIVHDPIILSNNFENNILKAYSFVIIQER